MITGNLTPARYTDNFDPLTAAAPDLLAALKEVAEGCESRLRKGKDSGDLATLRLCRRAIAKAEGSKPLD